MFRCIGRIAQLVEQQTLNLRVQGSIPCPLKAKEKDFVLKSFFRIEPSKDTQYRVDEDHQPRRPHDHHMRLHITHWNDNA